MYVCIYLAIKQYQVLRISCKHGFQSSACTKRNDAKRFMV